MKMTARKAQTSVEIIMVIAMTLIIFLTILAVNTRTSANATESMRVSQSRNVLEEIRQVATNVYYQGEQASQNLMIRIPAGITDNTFDGNMGSITLNNAGDEVTYYKVFPFEVTGKIPTNQGVHEITIRAMDGFIIVGDRLLKFTPLNLSLAIPILDTYRGAFEVVNVIDSDVNISFSSEGNGFDVGILEPDITVVPEQKDYSDYEINVTSGISGLFYGNITATATDGETIEEYIIPIVVNVT